MNLGLVSLETTRILLSQHCLGGFSREELLVLGDFYRVVNC